MNNGNGKLPYMTFYLNDFFSDDKVVVMDRAQIGSYLCLLHAAWQQDQPGTLPDDDELLAKWAKCESLDWQVEKGIIMGPFKKVNGIWCQKRMMAEALKAKRLHAARAEAGQKGGASKARRLLQLGCSEAVARASDSPSLDGKGKGERGVGEEPSDLGNPSLPSRPDPNGPPPPRRANPIDRKAPPFQLGGAFDSEDFKLAVKNGWLKYAEESLGKLYTRLEFEVLMHDIQREFKGPRAAINAISRAIRSKHKNILFPSETGAP